MFSSTNLTVNGNGSQELTMTVLGCGKSQTARSLDKAIAY